jgi:ankyrin repeat protein
MISKKLMSLLLISSSFCWGDSASVVEVVNNDKQPLNVTQSIIVPEYTKATITTKLIELNYLENLRQELLKAILKDDATLVRSIVIAGINVNQEIGNVKPLVIAVVNNKLKACEALLELGANYNVLHEEKKLTHYCIIKRLKSASLLVKAGADFSGLIGPQNASYDVMYYALCYGDLELSRELVNRGYDTNKIESRALHYLVRNPNILENFLKNGFNPNLVIKNEQRTPLTTSISWGQNLQSVELLLEAGADVNMSEQRCCDRTPMFCAIECGNLKIIDLLMKYGASL